MTKPVDELGPVDAYRWLVFYGTRAIAVVALTKPDAIGLVRGRLGADPYTNITARRMRDHDLATIEDWTTTPDLERNDDQ